MTDKEGLAKIPANPAPGLMPISSGLLERWLPWPAIAAMFLLSLPLRLRGATPDISWLLTVNDAMLDGKTVYLDILETNPPGAFLLYLPASLLARATGLPAEAITFLEAYLVALAALWLTHRVLKESPTVTKGARQTILLSAAALMFLGAGDAFAQREYFAAALSLPIVTSFYRYHADGNWPAGTARVALVVCGALVIAIKPVFAIPGLATVLGAMAVTRSLAPLLSSGILISAVLGTAALFVLMLIFPAYLTHVMPLMSELYIDTRISLPALLFSIPAAIVLILMIITTILTPAWGAAVVVSPFLSSAIGFFVAYVLQAKGFHYHLYPCLLLSVLAAGVLCASGTPRSKSMMNFIARLRRPPWLVILPATLMLGMHVLLNDRRAEVDLSAVDVGLERPSVASISPDHSLGPPQARQLKGTWVLQEHSLWIPWYALFTMNYGNPTEDKRARLRELFDQSLAKFIGDIAREQPEILLVNRVKRHAWLLKALLQREPHLLDDYETISRQPDVEVLRRKR